MKTSVISRPSNIAGRAMGVRRSFWRKPEFRSFTIAVPDWRAPMHAFITTIPGVR